MPGLIVNGTITRTKVAPGADLVGYSGFSTSNYLEQPYNSDLDFGTGDFCIMGWANQNSNTGRIVRRGDAGGSYSSVITIDTLGGLRATITDDGFASFDALAYPDMPLSTWVFVSFVRSGNDLLLYVNGEVVDTTSVVFASGSLNDSNATLAVGISQTGSPYDGSLALWRISATAPTAEQIAKIYNDEKFLFQENAQASLAGTSDAVTALAHDPVTDLLHVGTSDGRSVFQGLRRVDNTTDAVSTAISASNDLIVEQ